MAVVAMSVNSVKVVLSDGDNSVPVVMDFDGRRDTGQEIAVRFNGLGRMVEVTFCIVGGVLQMATRNYNNTSEDKPQVTQLHRFLVVDEVQQ